MLPHRLKGRYLHTTSVSHYDGMHKKIIHFGGFDEVPEEDDPDTWHLMGGTTIVELGEWSAPHSHCCYGVHLIHSGHLTVLRWVKAGYWPQKVYGVFCRQEVHYWFLLCILLLYWIDNVNKQVSFHGNAPPSCKQRPLIKAALTLF